MKPILRVLAFVPTLVACGGVFRAVPEDVPRAVPENVPRAVRDSRQVAVTLEVIHTLPLEDTPGFLERSNPVPLPSVTLEELLRESPAATIPRPADPKIGVDRANPGSLGDGKRFEVSDDKLGTQPFVSHGKVDSSMGDCSGTAIGLHLVLTAGHCVHPGPGGQLATDITFAPAYPRGAWYRAAKAFVHDRWVRNKAWQWDYAILYFETPMAVTAYFGIRSEVNFGQWSPCNYRENPSCLRVGVFSYGYPAYKPYTGERLFYDPVAHSCTLCSSGQWPIRRGTLVFKVIGMDYWDMTCGASGGAWSIGTNHRAGGVVYPPPGPTGKEGTIVGINSFTVGGASCAPGNCCPISTGEIWSPQFTTDNDLQALYHQVVQNHPR